MRKDWRLFEPRMYRNKKKQALPYRLLKPRRHNPEQAYPLVLFLHGRGERGADNRLQLEFVGEVFVRDAHRKNFPCFIAAPQCPAGSLWVEANYRGDTFTQPARISRPLRLALEIVGALRKEFKIDPRRIYVTGLSMGGFGTWDLITRHPKKFAAAVPICAGADLRRARAIRELPLWTFHGDKDPVIKPVLTRNMVAALRRAGSLVRYTEYKGVPHDSWKPAYNEPGLFPWLFAQQRK